MPTLNQATNDQPINTRQVNKQPINIAINGFGRIGRSVVRALYENGRNQEFNLIAINELAAPEGIAHLLKYDTTHGRFPFDIKLNEGGDTLSIAGDKVKLTHIKELDKLPWQELNIDIVLDCTGKFGSKDDGQQH